MPDLNATQLGDMIADTKSLLRRADAGAAKLREALANHAQLLAENAGALTTIRSLEQAQPNLRRLAEQARRLSQAYADNSTALLESAEQSWKLHWINIGLGVSYLSVGISKLFDAYASLTGTGKWITSLKSAVTDTYMEGRKGDWRLSADPAVNAALVVGSTAGANFVDPKGVKKFLQDMSGSAALAQSALSAVIDLLKDRKALMKSPKDFAAVAKDPGLQKSTFAEKVAAAVDAAGKFSKLYNAYLASQERYDRWMQEVGTFKVQGVKALYAMQFADYAAALKCCIEALNNFYLFYRSAMDVYENYASRNDAYALIIRQTGSPTGDAFFLDIEGIASWKGADVDRQIALQMHSVNTAFDARDLVHQAMACNRELARLRANYGVAIAKLRESEGIVSPLLTTVMALDGELQTRRRSVEKQRDLDPMTVAVTLDLIDQQRRRIAPLLLK